LRPGEGTDWTRGRDGWSGVGTGGTGSVVEGSSKVRFVFCVFVFHVDMFFASNLESLPSPLFLCEIVDELMRVCLLSLCVLYHGSNLTFSIAPGWAFVESEDWWKDVRSA
jgi:hypothetical protein